MMPDQLNFAFAFVGEKFERHPEHKQQYGFREKYSHTKRVFSWVNKLIEHEQANADVLRMAAIFHDVGYIVSGNEHPKHSAFICAEYLTENGFEEDFKNQVVYCIENHGNKEFLNDSESSMELILLIEADCLDEDGAMSVLRDAISEGLSGDTSYDKTYKRLLERRIVRQPSDFFCVTETAKKIWIEKQRLYFDFIGSLKIDLDE